MGPSRVAVNWPGRRRPAYFGAGGLSGAGARGCAAESLPISESLSLCVYCDLCKKWRMY